LGWCLAFSRDGKALASGGFNGYVHVWDARTGRERRKFKAHGLYVSCLAFSPDGKTLATGAHQDHDVCLWDFTSGKEVRRCKGHTHPVDCVAFSPDGKTLASGCMGHSVRVWEVTTGRQLRCFGEPYPPRHYAHYMHAVAFSPDGKYLAAGGTKRWFTSGTPPPGSWPGP
jgi:WD40 repeat protein